MCDHPKDIPVHEMSTPQISAILDGMTKVNLRSLLIFIAGYCPDALGSALEQYGLLGEHPYPKVDSRPWTCQGCGGQMIGNPGTYCRECAELKACGLPTPRELVTQGIVSREEVEVLGEADHMVVEADSGTKLTEPMTSRQAMRWILKHGAEYTSPLKAVPVAPETEAAIAGTPVAGLVGYVTGECGHPVPVQEWEADYRKCEACNPSDRFVTAPSTAEAEDEHPDERDGFAAAEHRGYLLGDRSRM